MTEIAGAGNRDWSMHHTEQKIERVWAMPCRDTFSIPAISWWVDEELSRDERLARGLVIDPFAGYSKIAHVTNDLNPSCETDYQMDALDFLRSFESDSVDAVLYDPPYSLRQLKECYEGVGMALSLTQTRHFFSAVKDEIQRVIKPGGVVLSFGWSSMGMGNSRGFGKTRILMVAHGGIHNDTLCVSEMEGDK